MLILLGFVGPYAATWMGLNPEGIGADFSRTFTSFVLLFLIAWVLTRARGLVARAKALVAVGVLLCLIVVTNAVSDAQAPPPAAAAPR
jgi:heme A synthase